MHEKHIFAIVSARRTLFAETEVWVSLDNIKLEKTKST